jgi:hypothetical protein
MVKDLPNEIWKNIDGYDGDYQVSNMGRVKSFKLDKGGRILEGGINSSGYLVVNLSKNGTQKTIDIHALVAIYFKDHIPDGYKLVVNHIDLNRLNNKATNLEIVTNRVNTNKKHLKSTSKYTGVCWHKYRKKWISQILINNKKKHLGYFKDEYEAHLAYEAALKDHLESEQKVVT